jgi:hypothetical protein
MRIRDPGIRDGDSSDLGSGMEKSWIQDKHPGSSTLVAFVKTRCDLVLQIRIRCLFDPLICDLGWVESQHPVKFFNVDPGWRQFGSGMEKSPIWDPG